MTGVFEQIGSFGEFDDASQIHHGNLSRDMFDHSQVMADKHIGQIEFFAQVEQ